MNTDAVAALAKQFQFLAQRLHDDNDATPEQLSAALRSTATLVDESANADMIAACRAHTKRKYGE